MDKERIKKGLKKVLNDKFHSKILVGKPRTRWDDVVQRNALQSLRIRGWRREVRAIENEGVFWGRLGSKRSCSATHGWMEHNNIFTFYIKQIREVRNFCIPCLIQKPKFRLHNGLDDPRFESQQRKGTYPSSKSTKRL
jgi:hypothetical protein